MNVTRSGHRFELAVRIVLWQLNLLLTAFLSGMRWVNQTEWELVENEILLTGA